MPAPDLRVLSLGTLPMHPLWGETSPARTGHATTSLVRAGDAVLLVDPGLPPDAVAARLHERAGLRPHDVTHVFLTSFHPETRRGLMAFEHATWWISRDEREAAGVPMAHDLKTIAQAEAEGGGDDDTPEIKQALAREVGVLQRFEPAPDHLAPGVDLFPLPGVTPGMAGLLINEPTRTTLITGDAIPTREHLQQGQVPRAADLARAKDSFAEAIEIADRFVLGRDNWCDNPTRRPF